jgi:hypothetical protein
METTRQPGGIGEYPVGLGRTIEWHQHALKHLTPPRHTRPARIENLPTMTILYMVSNLNTLLTAVQLTFQDEIRCGLLS